MNQGKAVVEVLAEIETGAMDKATAEVKVGAMAKALAEVKVGVMGKSLAGAIEQISANAKVWKKLTWQ